MFTLYLPAVLAATVFAGGGWLIMQPTSRR
jgi:hypothetical protein